MEYLLDNLADLVGALGDKHLLLMLDFDGTLAPIAQRPAGAVIPEDTRRQLERLSKDPTCTVAIVSGRSLADVSARVGIPNIIYVGNHGLEISWPGGVIIVFAPPGFAAGLLIRLKKDLAAILASYPGVALEDKGCALAVHYRLVGRRNRRRVMACVRKVVRACGGTRAIEVLPGKMVVDLRPPMDVDKGTLVSMLIDAEKRRWGDDSTFALYVGDDQSDEEAFEAIGDDGIGVVVGRRAVSCAEYGLNDPADVCHLLGLLARGGAEAR